MTKIQMKFKNEAYRIGNEHLLILERNENDQCVNCTIVEIESMTIYLEFANIDATSGDILSEIVNRYGLDGVSCYKIDYDIIVSCLKILLLEPFTERCEIKIQSK